MTKEKYNKTLKEAGLTKKELAGILGVSHQTVNNWGSTNKVPYWIETWLENYIKSKDMDKVIEAVKPYIKSEES